MAQSQVGRKIIMAVTGIAMAAFVVVHLIGNAAAYSGPGAMNAYALALHSHPVLIWIFRVFMMTALSLHIYFGIRLTIENRTATSRDYAMRKDLSTTFAGRTMIWSGLMIGLFLMFHLLHFTAQVISPDLAASKNPDAFGRPDVFRMVLLSFRNLSVSLIYLTALTGLALHLLHSIQSSMQTLGLIGEKTFPFITRSGRLAAILICLGFAALPLAIFAGIIK